MKKLLLVLIVLCASLSFAQPNVVPGEGVPAATPTPEQEESIFGYLGSHSSLLSGVLATEANEKQFIEVRFVDDFGIGSGFRGAVKVSLFTLARSGESLPTPTVPTSIEEVTAYSDAELWVSVYKPVAENIAIEALGGIQTAMTSLTGKVGNPADPTKINGAIGVRAFNGDTNLTLAGGLIGSVSEDGDFLGFIPSLILHGYIPMPFAGTGWALVPELSVGVKPEDPSGRRQITRSFKVGISKHFGK